MQLQHFGDGCLVTPGQVGHDGQFKLGAGAEDDFFALLDLLSRETAAVEVGIVDVAINACLVQKYVAVGKAVADERGESIEPLLIVEWVHVVIAQRVVFDGIRELCPCQRIVCAIADVRIEIEYPDPVR